jgi:hypothetical protein
MTKGRKVLLFLPITQIFLSQNRKTSTQRAEVLINIHDMRNYWTLNSQIPATPFKNLILRY